MKKQQRPLILLLMVTTLFAASAWTQDAPAQPPAPAPVAAAESTSAPPPPPEAAQPAPATPQRMTLMDMVRDGGSILWVTMAMGFAAMTWAIYLLLTLTVNREVPPSLAKRAQTQVRAGDIRGAYQMCQEGDELLAKVLGSGLRMAAHDRYVVQEAMESEGERGAAALWQRIAYLNNVATLAPLLGLFGTVWGMMEAFGAIAYETAQVKSMAMAPSIAKAMITTAGGLMVAIPASAVYFFLRGRVLKIIAAVEAQATEFLELLSQRKEE